MTALKTLLDAVSNTIQIRTARGQDKFVLCFAKINIEALDYLKYIQESGHVCFVDNVKQYNGGNLRCYSNSEIFSTETLLLTIKKDFENMGYKVQVDYTAIKVFDENSP